MTVVLIVHLMAIALGTGMSVSNFLNLLFASGATGERAKALAGLRQMMARIADIVILVIWITGIALWTQLPPVDQPNAWFIAKLVFVIALTLCHGLARLTTGRMMRTGDKSLYPRLQLLVSGVWVSAFVAIILAVLAFET
jgi:uncharacterized membrane protein